MGLGIAPTKPPSFNTSCPSNSSSLLSWSIYAYLKACLLCLFNSFVYCFVCLSIFVDTFFEFFVLIELSFALPIFFTPTCFMSFSTSISTSSLVVLQPIPCFHECSDLATLYASTCRIKLVFLTKEGGS